MRDHRSTPGFRRGAAVGVVIGLVIGSASVATATFWIQGWQRFSDDFKVGYINGFLDMANMARNLEPGGWVDTKYPMIPQAKPVEWANVVNELYKDPANAEYSITSILQSAAHRLQLKYGPAESPQERARRRMQQQLEIYRKNREKAGKAEVETKTVPAPPKVVSGNATTASSTKEPAKKPARKWCRCDGKDPKAARAARKAAAAAKEAEEAAKAKSAPAGAATKTPPTQTPPAKTPPAATKPAEQKPETK